MEPYWNTAIEQQAIDRVHRLGQTREVTAIRLVVEKSIEEKMLELKKQKAELAQMTFKEGGKNKHTIHKEKLMSLKKLFD